MEVDMNYHTRITVPLSRQEFEALYQAAIIDYRHPREQARFILRSVLIGDQSQENKNPSADSIYQKETANGKTPQVDPA